MTAEADVEAEPEAGKSKLPLILGLVLAIAGGGGGFFAVSSGMLLGSKDEAGHEETAEDQSADSEEPKVSLAFVPLDPITVSLPSSRGQVILRFRGELEVDPAEQDAVTELKPRVMDVLNGYLRAVSIEELEDPAGLMRLRGQMLRRVQVVAGDDSVRDLLIMEFVIS